METPGKGVGNSSTRLFLEYKPVENLTPNPNNPRIHSDRQIRQIARSIEAFGFVFPVVISPSGQVVAGHGRVQAAKLLHLGEIPTVALQHLSETQLTALMLADNRLCEQSVWNTRLLGEQLKALSEVELTFSLETTGFELGEIDVLIESLQPDAENDPVADALLEAEASVKVTVPGDVWTLGRNRVLCGNALDAGSYLKVMDGRKANMAFIDPPYDICRRATGLHSLDHEDFPMPAGANVAEPTDFLTQVFNLVISQTTEGSMHFVVVDRHHTREVLIAGSHAYSKLKDICVWTKNEAEVGSFYRNQHELVFVFENGKNRLRDSPQPTQRLRPGRNRSNVWRYPRSKSRSRVAGEGHSVSQRAATPVPLVADAILDCSNRGDLVLDPFLGNGTAVIAAERTGRICYGIEIDPHFVDTIIRRWQTFTGLSAKHASSGRSFREREEEVGSGLKH